MRLYHIVSGIPLILPIIDFAVAAPVLVQVKRQAAIDARIPEDSMTMFGKRGNELGDLSEVWPELFQDSESHSPLNQGEVSATRPSSISQPPLPDDSMAVEKLPPTVHEQPSQVLNPEHAPPFRGEGWNELLINFFGHSGHSFENPVSSSARPSSSLQPSGPTSGSMNVEQPLPLIHEEPLKVPSSNRGRPKAPYWMERVLFTIEANNQRYTKPAVTGPSSSSPPLGPAGGSVAVKGPQPLPSVSEEPSQVPSLDHAPAQLGGNNLNEIGWDEPLINFYRQSGHSFAKPALSSGRLSSSSQPSGLTGGSMNVEKPASLIHDEPIRGRQKVPYWMQRTLLMIEANNQHYTKPTVIGPSSSSPLLGPAGGSVAVKRPRPPSFEPSPESSSLSSPNPKQPVQPPSTSEESPHVSASDNEQLRKAISLNMWRGIVNDVKKNTYTKSTASSVTPPSFSSQSSGLAGGTIATKKAKPSISKKPSKVSLYVIDHPEDQTSPNPKMFSATQLSSMLQPWGHADGSVPVEKPPVEKPSIPDEPSQVSSPHRAPLSVGNEVNNMWLNLIGQPEKHPGQSPEELSVAYSPHASLSPGSESPVSDHEVESVRPPSSPGLESTVSDHEMERTGSPPRPGPLSSTEPDVSTNPGG